VTQEAKKAGSLEKTSPGETRPTTGLSFTSFPQVRMRRECKPCSHRNLKSGLKQVKELMKHRSSHEKHDSTARTGV